MRKFLDRLFISLGYLLTVIEYMTFNSPVVAVSNVSEHVRAIGIKPPIWLEANNADHIVRIVAAIIFSCGILYFICRAVDSLYVRWRNQELKGMEAITKLIRSEEIPNDGNWEPILGSINQKLLRLISRRTRITLKTDVIEITPSGRYKYIPRSLADWPCERKTSLKVLLWVYFDGADAVTVQRIMNHDRGDPITVIGTLTLADISRMENGYCLNIDLNKCTLAA